MALEKIMIGKMMHGREVSNTTLLVNQVEMSGFKMEVSIMESYRLA